MGNRGDEAGSHRCIVAKNIFPVNVSRVYSAAGPPSRIRRTSMAGRPGDRQWTRRDFVSAVGAGLAGGAALAGRPRAGGAQGALKTFTASHSVSTVVYGQHLVAA